ncbi:hypothetical protein AYI68_g896 [Smittium mucronatum]|uniref:Uncharacterized protein n=1 Tax=Smittium mucronatum TaxID=133383 RepID=A0A1R0H729_9FUNG|nr:hypothetical protein AYI68_g896 [Smittium mucronatum]
MIIGEPRFIFDIAENHIVDFQNGVNIVNVTFSRATFCNTWGIKFHRFYPTTIFQPWSVASVKSSISGFSDRKVVFFNPSNPRNISLPSKIAADIACTFPINSAKLQKKKKIRHLVVLQPPF